MARLSKESQKKFDEIIKYANLQVYGSLRKLYAKSQKINTIVNKELSETKNNKRKIKKAADLSNSLYTKSTNLFNTVYTEGAQGLKIHKDISEIKRITKSLEEIDLIVNKEIIKLNSILETISGLVAKTGFIDPAITPKQDEPEKPQIPSELKFVISNLSTIIDDINLSDEILYLARGFLGKIIKLIHVGGDEYHALISNECKEAQDMLDTVFRIKSQYDDINT
jgi:hypothetical protein